MRALLLLMAGLAVGQSTFDVVSVRPTQRVVGPDYNNRLTYTAAGIKGENVTLKRLVAEAYRVQMKQVLGPRWLEQNEYDLEARAGGAATREEMALMLRSVLAERFQLRQHSETLDMRVYELVPAKTGVKIAPLKDGEKPGVGDGFPFQGDMRAFADLLAVRLSIPAANSANDPARAGPPILVVDKTGLSGVYAFPVRVQPEVGTDGFTLWQRALREQLGLTLENRKEKLPVLVVDDAEKVPTEN